MLQPPAHTSYDVVIIGGAMMGSAAAWFLTEEGFDGRILVVEMDPSYSACSTAHTNSCIRQQFSHPLNIRISQFGAAFIESAYERLGEVDTPRVRIQNYGYLYLADSPAFADHLRAAQAVQAAHGAGTELLTPDEIAARYPFYALDDILLGSLNTKGEGYWDYAAIFDGWRKSARARGVEYIQNRVVEMSRRAGRIESVSLASGESITCGQIINATGPRAAETAALAGLHIPVEPRKRFTWIFSAETPLDRPLPLTIDPSGIHVRQDGPTTYLAGGHAEHDPAVDPTDFT
ncbi:MAG: FAD-dependent oxidoreductase, partial [Pseudomonadota bacterium]